MAALLLHIAQQNRRRRPNGDLRNMFVERLLSDPNDVLRFGDTTLISRYRLPWAMILGLAEELRPFLERPTRRHGALPVVVKLTNASAFCRDFLQKVTSRAK